MSSSSTQVPLQAGQTFGGCGGEIASEETYRTWKCLYPNYIDRTKSCKEGRRLTANKAVVRPTIADMLEICKKHNIPFVAENKAYSRDWMIRGRIRVNLTSIEDESVNTKMKLMSTMGFEIPQLKIYLDRLAREDAMMRKAAQADDKPVKSKRK